MTQVMTPQVVMSELGYHVVPVRGVTQDRGGDPTAARAGEQTRHRIIADDIQPSLHERAYLPDDWHPSCPLALGAHVNQAARALCYLAPGSGVPV
jgi:hypothetical protein